MNHARFIFSRTLPLLALMAALTLTAARADEYGDVNKLISSNKLAEAMAKVDQHLASKPRDPQMRFLKGVIQRDSGKQAEAINTFTKLTEDYPELPEPYNNLAVLYAGQNQFDKARAALEMAIRTNPSYATAHENLGDVYAKLASQAYSKALQLESSPAVPPKLALIRELFNPGAKGQRPASSSPAAPAAVPATTPPASAPAAPAPAAVPAAVAPAPALAPAKPAATDAASKDVEAAVRAWAAAWAAKDMSAYLAAYGKEFAPPGKLSRSAWEAERRLRITAKSRISVKLVNLTVSVEGSKATAKFRQDYNADSLAISSRKMLQLSKSGERWLIVKEATGG
jgi:tetratricopeptide (TPR) repeat protein